MKEKDKERSKGAEEEIIDYLYLVNKIGGFIAWLYHGKWTLELTTSRRIR